MAVIEKDGGGQIGSVITDVGITLLGEGFSCCLRGSGNRMGMGGGSDARCSFLTVGDCIVLVLRLEAGRYEGLIQPCGQNLDMDSAFTHGEDGVQSYIGLVAAFF
jgi:hypothetical protein